MIIFFMVINNFNYISRVRQAEVQLTGDIGARIYFLVGKVGSMYG